MSTSGTQTFTQSKNELISDALNLIGEYGIGRTISAEDLTFCSNMLNKMVKAWATDGLHLFTKEEGVLYLTPGTARYVLGSTAKATKLSDEVTTQLNGTQATAATVLTLDSTTGMLASDNIGVVLSDKTVHWTSIVSVDSSTQVTLTSGLSGPASDNAYVYTYTTALPRPLRILDSVKRTGIGTTITDMLMSDLGYSEYKSLPVKLNQSSPNQYSVLPRSDNLEIYIWPCPGDGADRIVFTYERVVEDLTNTSDNFDFPPEWLEALTYQLAVRLCRPFGKPAALKELFPLASLMLQKLLDWDSEICCIQMSPDVGGY